MKFCQSLMYAPAADWAELTRCAEDVGFDQVSLSDHVFYPGKLESSYPYSRSGRPSFPPETPWPDVWVMTGALAAATERIRFATHVYVLPARNPFVVAKAVGTAAYLSGDRVLLGVGAGWMREEFDQLEQPFAGRGARMEEQIEVLRTLWRGGMVEHHGEFYDFDKLEMAPAPAQRRAHPHRGTDRGRATAGGTHRRRLAGHAVSARRAAELRRAAAGLPPRVRHGPPAVRDPGGGH